MMKTPIVWVLAGMLSLLGLSACSSSGTTSVSSNSTGASLTSITLSPANPAIAEGATQQFTVTGTYSDGSTQDITAAATWTSSGNAAYISSTGLATAVAAGTTTITVTVESFTLTTTLTVTPALVSIAVTPASPGIAVGATQQLTATGTYSDSTTQNITGSVVWSSSDAGRAAVSATGLATGVAAGSSVITATSGAVSGTATVTVTPTLVSIAVTPAGPSITIGATQQCTATGTYSDGTTQDITGSVIWTSASAGNATITSAGLATGIAAGSSVITATSASISGTTTLTVSRTLVSIAVTPVNPSIAIGATQQFTAMGTYDDGLTLNMTGSVVWSSSNTGKATITNAGLATGVADGSATITATSGSIFGTTTLTVTRTLTSIAVTPSSPSIAIGATQQFTATGTYNDGFTQDISALVSWTSSTTAKATITNAALATGVAAGSATITATAASGSVFGTTTLTVTRTLTSIAVTPSSASIARGATQQFTATGTYDDGFTQNMAGLVSWTSSTTAATITNGGIATGVNAAGPITITATTTLEGISGTATLTVTRTLVSIAVTPSSPSITIGATQQFTATGTYDDSFTQDISGLVSWTSSTTAATISSAGTATGVAAGSATITATSGSIFGIATLTVTRTLTSIAVLPSSPSIKIGATLQFTATGTYDDGWTQNLTGTTAWNSSDESKATISTSGTATGVADGTSIISATTGSVTGSITLTVTRTLTSIAVLPSSPSIAIGATQLFTATGTYDDSFQQDISGLVTWASNTTAKATITGGGLATGVAAGSALISATTGSVAGSTLLTVTRTLVTIDVTPVNPTILIGATQQFIAQGNYDDGFVSTLTSSVTWESSDPGTATISSAGTATGVAVGTTTIRATVGTVFGETTLNVDPTLSSIDVTPHNPAITVGGGTQQFTATGTYSDASTQVITGFVTWSSSTTGAVISTTGFATAINPCTATITAVMTSASGTVSGSTQLTVNPSLQSIIVTPPGTTIEADLTQQFTATGTYSDGSEADITLSVVWSSSTGNATISSAGTATGVSAGVTDIIATAMTGTIFGTTTLTVITLDSIEVRPAALSLQINKTQQFTAIGHYSNGTTSDLTSSVTWSTSNDTIATIDANGLATASDTNTGPVNITASTGSTLQIVSLTVWKLAVGSPFGFHPAMVSKAGYTPNAGPTNSSEDATYLGVTWTRETLYAYWDVIQPDLGVPGPGGYDFAQFDLQWSKVPAGMNVLANISPCTLSAPSGTGGYCKMDSYLPDNETQYTDFVTAVISRYTTSYADAGLLSPIKYWQVGNEPVSNGTNSFAGLQRITWTAIKAACPDCTVLIGGVPGMPPVADYLTQFDAGYKPILEALAGQYVDILDFHWYGNATGDYLGARDVYDHIRAELDANGFSGTPIWITEMGAYSGDPTTMATTTIPYGLQTEQQQALDLFKRYVYSLSLGVERIFPAYGLMEGYWDDGGYFDFTGLIYDGSDPSADASTDLGLGVKKLGYYTYKKMTEMLEGSDWNIQTITATDDSVHIFKIMKGATPTYVAWWDYFSDEMAVTDIKEIAITGLSGATVTVTEAVPNSATGSAVTYNASAFTTTAGVPISGGTATVTINGNPVFVTIVP